MTVDWTHFTPWSALAGGALIGLSAALLVLLTGRIAGISGILGNALAGLLARRSEAWIWAFLAGLLLAPLAWRVIAPLPPVQVTGNTALLLGAGWLVGLSTRYGAGCTSGHGVCGLARLSPRSLAATLSFMAAGFVTVYLLHRL